MRLLLCAIAIAWAIGAAGTPAARAQQQLGIERVAGIALGSASACSVIEQGGVRCWGANDNGELGDGSNHPHTTPVEVPGIGAPAAAVTAGYGHSCALTDTGGVTCWGANTSGQLGAHSPDVCGVFTCSLRPIEVQGLASGVRQVVAGFSHTCAVTSGGGLMCWGFNLNGQLGDGTHTDRPSPVDVSGLTHGVVSVAPGDVHSCAVIEDSTVKCWGSNSAGELGNGTRADSATPVRACLDASCLQPLGGILQLALGLYHTCALDTLGGVWCWGANDDRQLGDASSEQCGAPVAQECRPLPVRVSGFDSPVTQIAAAGLRTCALLQDGAVACWGEMFGRAADWPTPTLIDGMTAGMHAIAVGYTAACGVTDRGEAVCFGKNGRGQLGDGTTRDRDLPAGVWTLSDRGDANCDRTVSSLDAFLVLQLVARLIPSLPCPNAGGAQITSYDALLILQFSAGLMK